MPRTHHCFAAQRSLFRPPRAIAPAWVSARWSPGQPPPASARFRVSAVLADSLAIVFAVGFRLKLPAPPANAFVSGVAANNYHQRGQRLRPPSIA